MARLHVTRLLRVAFGALCLVVVCNWLLVRNLSSFTQYSLTDPRWSDRGGLPIRGVLVPGCVHVANNNSHALPFPLVTAKGATWMLVSDDPETKHVWSYEDIATSCEKKVYDLDPALQVSVVITYHAQESLVNILHTVHALVRRTDPTRLAQVVLVDDASQKGEQLTVMVNYLAAVFPTITFLHLHMDSHVGLIKARLAGFRAADGPVIVCMDSHVEVQPGWLEPLLSAIQENKSTLAASHLDWMHPLTALEDGQRRWRYEHGGSNWRTQFDWYFRVGFQRVPARQRKGDVTQVIPSPSTIGTLLAIRKDFFTQIGELDDSMEGWGGENVDLALRTWMCGGRVVNVPCSHVGHMEETGARNYRSSWQQQIKHNYKRVAETWFDDTKKHFYEYFPEALQMVEAGDLKRMKLVRSKCPFPFSWFLTNVFPELGVPDLDGLAWGGVMNTGAKQCLDLRPDGHIQLDSCVPRPERQGFYWSKDGYLRLPLHIVNNAYGEARTGPASLRTEAILSIYNEYSNTTHWLHRKDGLLLSVRGSLCLQAREGLTLTFASCNVTEPRQQWSFRDYTPAYFSLVAGQRIFNNPMLHERFTHFLSQGHVT